MVAKKPSPFSEVEKAVSPSLRAVLAQLDEKMKDSLQEIRLRTGRPLSVVSGGQVYFIGTGGKTTTYPAGDSYFVTPREVMETFQFICDYSIHAHQGDIVNGFLTIAGGHRAGICGTAVVQDGRIIGVKDVSSINLRVARTICGAGDEAMSLFRNGPVGILFSGAPGSGKTTLIRDVTRQLSIGKPGGRSLKVALVDERGELAAVYHGVPQNDVGPSTDILDGYPKETALHIAIKTLSPDVLICDEVMGQAELDAVAHGVNCGASVIASVHAGSIGELLEKEMNRALLRTGAFRYVVQLGDMMAPGKINQVIEVAKLDLDKDHRPDIGGSSSSLCGGQRVGKTKTADPPFGEMPVVSHFYRHDDPLQPCHSGGDHGVGQQARGI